NTPRSELAKGNLVPRRRPPAARKTNRLPINERQLAAAMAGLTPRVMALSMKGRVYTRTNAGWTFRDCRANSNRPSKALAVLSKARKRPKEARFRANEGEPPPESDLKSEQDGSSRDA